MMVLFPFMGCGDLGNLHHQFIFSKEGFLFAIVFSTGNEC
jgi:hypothetical protein